MSKPMVISYSRFSSIEQRKGFSKERQSDAAQTYCLKNNLKLTDALLDAGISAFRGLNATAGDLSVFLKMVRDGKIPQGSILLVEQLDRISRQQPENALALFLDIIRAGIKIVTLKNGAEFQTGKLDMGQLMMSVMLLCTSHEESAKKSYWLGDAWKRKRAALKEKPFTRMIPAWLKMEDGKIVIDKPKAEIVKMIFKLASKGYGMDQITKKLNKEAVGMARSEHFNRSYIHKILHTRAVLGEFQPHKLVYAGGKKKREPVGEPLPNYYPRIISDDLFYAVSTSMKSRTSMRGPSSQFINLFTGLLHYTDGFSVRIDRKDSHRRYASSGAIDGKKGAAPYVAFPVKPFEEAMLLRLGEPSLFMRSNNSEDLQVMVDSLEGQLAEINTKIENIQDGIMSGGKQSASVVGLLNRLDAQKSELAEKLESAKENLSAFTSGADGSLKDMLELIHRAGESELKSDERISLRNVIHKLVERINCHFIREGRDYICGSEIILRNGNSFDFTFRANHQSQMLRDKLGHPIRHKGGTPPETKYEVEIKVA